MSADPFLSPHPDPWRDRRVRRHPMRDPFEIGDTWWIYFDH
jgi:hypothetical protein